MTEQAEHTYDLFISYADADRAWVEGYLLDALTQAGVRCHSEAAFALGVPRLLEFERAIRQSQRTLLILSPATLAEGFGQFTDLLAQSYGLETATWPVIPLILHPVELPPRLAMLTALDASDPADWPAVVERLCAELQRPVPGPAPRPPCPYPGMVPFSEEDSDRFFGRDGEIQELLERLRLHPFVTVIGPSGSGKSSLVFAGLVPALRQSGLFGPGGWLVRTLRPGEAPLAALTAALGGDAANPAQAMPDLLSTHPDARRLLLVVDQFEELFTLAHADVEPFQEALLRLAETPNCYVLLTVRADFYPDLMGGSLWREIQTHRAEVLPLDEDGLRQAIVRPAEDAGVFVETALVERLVADAGREPGVLPLVQETLVLLWERVERRFLPLRAYDALVLSARDYRELGGVQLSGLQVAMARRADVALAGLTPEQQPIARRIFLRLVQFGEGRADTRRQQPVAALRVAGDEPEAFDRTLEHLTRNRLLTLSGEEGGDGRRVDIAHESLIAGWPTFQGWLTERREAEQTRRRLEAKAAEWVRLGRGTGGLLDEVELLEAKRWLASPDGADLGYSEALPALIQASRAAQEEAATQRRQVARFRVGALGVIAALIIVALGLGLWSTRRNAANLEAIAQRESQLAQQQQEAAATAQAYAIEQQTLAQAEATARAEALTAQATAEQQARVALSRQLAAQSSNRSSDNNHEVAMLLAIEAGRAADTAEAFAALRQAFPQLGRRLLTLYGHTQAVNQAVWNADESRVLTASNNGTARVWDAETGEELLTLSGDTYWGVNQTLWNADESRILTASNDGTARVWDAEVGTELLTLSGHTNWVNQAVWNADGTRILTASWDDTARVWDAETGEELLTLSHTDHVNQAVWNADESRILTASRDGTARVWDAETGMEFLILFGHTSWVNQAVWNADESRILTASNDGTARVWDAETEKALLTLSAHKYGVNQAVWNADESLILTSGCDNYAPVGCAGGTARVWDVETGVELLTLSGQADDVWRAEWNADESLILTSGCDRYGEGLDCLASTARVWDAETGAQLLTLSGQAAVWNTDESRVLTASEDGTARVWSTEREAELFTLFGHTAVWNNDGSRILTASNDGTARVWDAETGKELLTLSGHTKPVDQAVWSADESRILTTRCDRRSDDYSCVQGTAGVWDAETGEELLTLSGHTAYISQAVWKADGSRILTASWDGTARMWDAHTGEELLTLIHGGWVNQAVWNADESRILTAASWDNTARVWDAQTGEELLTLSGHTLFVHQATWNADESRILTASNDGTARVWDAKTGEELLSLSIQEGVGQAVWNADESRILTVGTDHIVRIWDAETGEELLALSGHTDYINRAAWNANESRILTASEDGTARVWEAKTGEELLILFGDAEGVGEAWWNPDESRILTVSWDGTAQVWYARMDDLLEAACQRVHRNLSRQEWGQYFPQQAYRKTCPNLLYNPIVIVHTIEQGMVYARSRWVDDALAEFEKALNLEPDVVAAYAEAQELDPTLEIAAESWNTLCWYGSLLGQAAEVLDACEYAVEQADESHKANYRDSRGLARALTGDYAGAIEDLRAFVEWAQGRDELESLRLKREAWIIELEAGRNPFDAQTLQALRNE
jgi:WD40 repeat protein